MSDVSLEQTRIAQLEQTVGQLRERIAALEAVQPHMATKADLVDSKTAPRFSFGGRKRKNAENTYWINNDRNFAFTLMAVIVLTLILAPTVASLLAALLVRVF